MGKRVTVDAGEWLRRLRATWALQGQPAAMPGAQGATETPAVDGPVAEDPRVTAARLEFDRMRRQMRRTMEMIAARDAASENGGVATPLPAGPSAPAHAPPSERGSPTPPASETRVSVDGSLLNWAGLPAIDADKRYMPAAPIACAVALLGAAGALLRAEPDTLSDVDSASDPSSNTAQDAAQADAPARAASAALMRQLAGAAGEPNDVVAALQTHLTVLGYGPDVVNGLFGPRTRIAIEDFMNQEGLVDAVTLETLMNGLAAAERDGRTALFSRNNPGLAQVTIVRVCQQFLTDMGYEPGPVDGDAGEQTITAARAFAMDAAVAFKDFDLEFAQLLRDAADRGHAARLEG